MPQECGQRQPSARQDCLDDPDACFLLPLTVFNHQFGGFHVHRPPLALQPPKFIAVVGLPDPLVIEGSS